MTLKRLHEQGISGDELRSAKTYIKGQFPPQIETTDRLTATIAELELEFFGLDEREVDTLYSKVDAMTLTDANRIIREYFSLENLVFVLIGKASEIEPVVKKYAKTVDRKGITGILAFATKDGRLLNECQKLTTVAGLVQTKVSFD